MSISLQSEVCLSLTEAAKNVPPIDGRRPHASTVWRWCRKGLRGVRLEHTRLGHRVVTSAEALQRFTDSLAELDANQPDTRDRPVPTEVPRPKPQCRARSIEKAKKKLRSVGILT